MKQAALVTSTFGPGAVSRALNVGWDLFCATRSVSVTYAMIFAIFGLITIFTVEHLGTAPMALPLAGGFMLVGPILLVGYFRVADIALANGSPRMGDTLSGFRSSPRELWAVAAVSMLFYLIWITDAATLYGFMVGSLPTPIAKLVPADQSVVSFVVWSSVMGSVLAFIIFATTAFTVPLLYYRRAGLVPAIITSVKAVFANFFVAIGWALLLAVAVIGSILILPLFLVVFPVMAFASHALYRELFPDGAASGS